MSSPSPLAGREILLGIGAGIAAYKAADLTSKLVQAGAAVSVAMTENATAFIGPTTFEALTGRPVHVGQYTPTEHFRGEHIGLAERADVYVVAPATADLLGKFAHGLADDLVTTLALTATCPVVVAPAMNTDMWEKPAVARNVARLREDGFRIVEPGEGWLSCGRVGAGRMAEVTDILAAIESALAGAA
ncbi:MAG: flavoprotein [Planctomycetota bacterium]